MQTSRRPKKPRNPWRVLAWIATIGLSLAVAAFLALTDGAPLVEPQGPPAPAQASAVKRAVDQLRGGRLLGSDPVTIHLTSEQLSAAGTLASDAFKPDRLLIEFDEDRIDLVGSHWLGWGRWLNAGVVSGGSKSGFPQFHLTVGSVKFPPWMARSLLEAARHLANLRGAKVPPLDEMVHSIVISDNQVWAKVSLPPKSGIFDLLLGDRKDQGADNILKAYCRLTALQYEQPVHELPMAIRRAIAAVAVDSATAESNRDALIALAMFNVSPQVGELVGLTEKDVRKCAKGPFPLKLRGRNDLSMHWSLSAALALTTGVHFSETLGQWKELADSASGPLQFARGDPSGFSFLDLAADRSGFLMAQAAVTPSNAQSMARRMSEISEDDILPARLMSLEDGLPANKFEGQYGSIRDPRFIEKIELIDHELYLGRPE